MLIYKIKYLYIFFIYIYMKYDSTTNILILGESNSGKTTLIYNYLYNNLNTKENITTIGVDYYKKLLYNEDKTYLVNLYDTGNGLLYRNILNTYLRKSEIFIIVLRKKSLIFVKEVLEIINSDSKINPLHIFIIYNKNLKNCDFTFNELEISKNISKNNSKKTKLYFSYINLLDKFDIEIFFNNLSKYIFDNNDNNKKINKLISLNIKDNTVPISSKKYKKQGLYCCDKFCVIS